MNNFDFGQIEATQSGTVKTIDSGDPRLSSFTMNRNDRLWIAHSGGAPVGAVDRTNVYWYELDPADMVSSGTPIVQSGVIDGGAATHHIYPSIAANKDDAAFLGMSRSDSTKFVEAIAVGRDAVDAAGTMSSATIIKLGEDSYVKTFSGTQVRWGDYSATAVDPSDDTGFWTIQEYAETDVGGGPSDDRWGTWWAKSAVCGNGVTETGESCDEGVANGQFGSCCSSTCTFELASTLCRNGSGDLCDADEFCSGSSGSCPTDIVAPIGTVCNPGSGDICDADEVCSGVALMACPADVFDPGTTVCDPGSGDLCDLDEL